MKSEIGKSYIEFSEENEEIVVDKVFVHESQRGEYLGHKLLDIALNHAKSVNMNLSLYAEPDEDMEIEKLVEYYQDYGFESDGDCDQLMTYYI
jgi:predicted GNAT family N-acyltransferase